MMREHAHWSEWVRECETRGDAYVLVTVLGARGSTPRDSGTKMVVCAAEFRGTIGGGTLEYQALERARDALAANMPGQWLENYPLGEKLGQCCGGSTSLLFECFVPQVTNVYLFGAGHVGRALAPILGALPLNLHWVDARVQEFPQQIPNGVTVIQDDDPLQAVHAADAGSYFIIMTHQHPLDYALMEAALQRGDAGYIGVIGSESKARRFRMRLAHRGYDDDAIATVRCPIGAELVPGKRPAEIAVSVAAELISLYHAQRGDLAASGPSWKQLQGAAGHVDDISPTTDLNIEKETP